MRVEMTVSYTKSKIVEVDATPETFRAEMLSGEADAMAGDASVPLEWDRTIFENADADPGGDTYLDEIK